MAKKSSSKVNKAKKEVNKQLKKKSTTSKKTTTKKQVKSTSSTKKSTTKNSKKVNSNVSKKQVNTKKRNNTRRKTNKTVKVVKQEVKEKEELLVPFEDSGKDKIIVPEEREINEKESIRDSIFIVNEVKDKDNSDSLDNKDVLIDDESSFYTTDLSSIIEKEESPSDDINDISEFDFTDKLEKVDLDDKEEIEQSIDEKIEQSFDEEREESTEEENPLDSVNVLVDSEDKIDDVIITNYQDDYDDVFDFDKNDDYSEYKEDLTNTGNLLKQKEDELQSLYEKDSNDIEIKDKVEDEIDNFDNNKDEYVVDYRTTTDKILNGIVITLFGIFILLFIAFIIFIIYICTY